MKQISLFHGVEHSCSYLPDLMSRSAYVDPRLPLDLPTYSNLAEQGFRRSGDLVYRPNCRHCAACLPIRLPVIQFSPNRSQLRNLRNNADLVVTPKPAAYDEEHYQLFLRYLAFRHGDGDMASSSPDDYIGFLGSDWSDTWFVEFRLHEQLLSVAVVDRLEFGLSAVYTFFDPAYGERGLGTLAVLWQIEKAIGLGLDWLYLGFWIEACRKMNYKANFRPLQALIEGEWRSFEKGEKIGM